MIGSGLFKLLLLAFGVYSTSACGPAEYYDGVVSRCSPCEDICLNAKLQGTADQCAKKCPDFKLTPGTPEETKETSSGFRLPQGWMALIIILAIVIALAGAALAYKKREEMMKVICRLRWERRNRNEDEMVHRAGARDEETGLKQVHALVDAGNEEHEGAAAGRNEEEKEMIPATHDLQADQSDRGQHKNHYS